LPKARPLVHLLDSHVYIFRAWVTLPDMPAPDGRHTGAAYGFANTLLRYLREREPVHIACCFDFAMTSFRNERFPAYKSSRGDEVPDDLEPQFEMAKDAARAAGFASYEAEGYEADDVIATLTGQILEQGGDVVIVTSDKDLSQLVTEDGRVTLYDLQRETALDADGVREKFGVDPARIPDYLALVGDRVDDLPGVPGYGKKGAAAALGAFETLEAIPGEAAGWENVAVRGAARLAERIEAHRAQALEIRELATVVRDVPGVKCDLPGLVWQGADRGAFEALCSALGWGRIATRIPRWA
jgi:5'-3' exonuclease